MHRLCPANASKSSTQSRLRLASSPRWSAEDDSRILCISSDGERSVCDVVGDANGRVRWATRAPSEVKNQFRRLKNFAADALLPLFDCLGSTTHVSQACTRYPLPDRRARREEARRISLCHKSSKRTPNKGRSLDQKRLGKQDFKKLVAMCPGVRGACAGRGPHPRKMRLIPLAREFSPTA